MPRRSKAQLAALAVGRLRTQGQNPTVAEQLKSTKAKLNTAKSALGRLQSTQTQLVSSTEDYKGVYKALRNERRKHQRAIHIKILKTADAQAAQVDAARAITLLDNANSKNKDLRSQLTSLLEQCVIERQSTTQKIKSLEGALSETRHKNRIYARQCARIPEIKKTAVKKANKENKKVNLLHKGVYSPAARQLARVLTHAGCSRQYVSKVIKIVCETAGIEVKGDMSRRTVGRVILEGGMASEVQLGHEIMATEGK